MLKSKNGPNIQFGHHTSGQHSDSAENTHVVLICNERFTREMIEIALQRSAVSLDGSFDDIDGIEPVTQKTEVVIWVESSTEAGSAQFDSKKSAIGNVRGQNWIVICRSKDSVACEMLSSLGANVSAVPFDISPDDLAHLTKLAANSRRVFVDQFCDSGSNAEARRIRSSNLSREQQKTLHYLSEGLSNKEIALLEECTENTIKMRVRSVLTKMGVDNRTRAAVIAARAGFRLSEDPGLSSVHYLKH